MRFQWDRGRRVGLQRGYKGIELVRRAKGRFEYRSAGFPDVYRVGTDLPHGREIRGEIRILGGIRN